MKVVPFRWHSDRLDVLDQRLLPTKMTYARCRTAAQVAQAIRDMAVRGAPAIGCCAAYGLALAVRGSRDAEAPGQLARASVELKAARPTAVNLAWAVDRVVNSSISRSNRSGESLAHVVLDEARILEKEDVGINREMSRHGAKLLPANAIVLTHCNTGALATAGIGTALGVVREAASQGKIKKVFVDETRPYLQGARLTAWELGQEKIPHELITDSMAAFFMDREKVSAVIVGCDRVAANGDTANKIGTYGLAILAKYHRVPFYVAMPTSTLDLSIKQGGDIPIEERSSEEVVRVGTFRIAPLNTPARHPAFDVTPADLITAFITEKGVIRPPFQAKLKKLKDPIRTKP